MQQIVEEHKNNEKAYKLMMTTRDSLVENIINIHLKLKDIQTKSVAFVSESIEKLGVCEYSTIFSQHHQNITDDILDLSHRLSHPKPVVFYSQPDNGEYQRKNTLTIVFEKLRNFS